MARRKSNTTLRRMNDQIARQRWAVSMSRLLPVATTAETAALQDDLRMIGAVR
jgi:hypothetical protein